MTKIALTGARGMTGRHMLALLREKEIPCLALTRKEWDICQWKSFNELDLLFDSCHAVFHFAAQLPGENSSTLRIFDANVRSCLNLAEWAASRSIPLIFLSGATVYKYPHRNKISELDEKVVNGFGGFYGYSKLLAENVIEHYRCEGLKSVILRPSSIYGYGLSGEKLIPKYLSQASAGQTINIPQPDNRINLIHAYDVARAALSAFESQSWGVFNIGSDNHSVIEIAQTAIKISGRGKVSMENADETYEPFTRFDLDRSLATSTFGFKPIITLEHGIKLMRLGKERAC